MQHLVWNMLSNLKNGFKARKKSITCSHNLYCIQILKIIYKQGYICGFRKLSKSPLIEVFLKYNNGKPTLSKIIFFSKPTKRFYVSSRTLWKLNLPLETLILSTSAGVLSDKLAKKKFLGGELICYFF